MMNLAVPSFIVTAISDLPGYGWHRTAGAMLLAR